MNNLLGWMVVVAFVYVITQVWVEIVTDMSDVARWVVKKYQKAKIKRASKQIREIHKETFSKLAKRSKRK